MPSPQFEAKDLIVFSEFQGMNTQAARHDLDEKKAAWMENLQPIGKNNLLSVPAPDSALATIGGETIIEQFSAPINGIDYLINFTSSGAGWACNLATGATTKFADAGTFSGTQNACPDMTVWNLERILIADATAGYCTWDGTLFVKSGGVSPNIEVTVGGNYAGTPTVTISGGSGSGATAIAIMTGTAVTSIQLTNPGTGYLPGDVLTVSFSGGSQAAGTVIGVTVKAGGSGYVGTTVGFSGGGGASAAGTVTTTGGVVISVAITNPGSGYTSDPAVAFTGAPGVGATGKAILSTDAQASAHVWPSITPKPTTIAVYQGRVWLAQKNVITYTGTGASFGGVGYDDFDTADASGTFTIDDTDLVHSITALRNLNNYLFVVGDNSVKQIGNITVNVNTNATGFTIVTLSSDQGTTFRNSIISFNRLLLFTNTVGVYAVFGTSVEKISDEMDGVFRRIDFDVHPTASVNDVNNIHTFLLAVQYNDPSLGAVRTLILAFMNKKWFVISQGNEITNIVTVSIDGITDTYSSSGDDITKILADTTQAVDIKLQSSLTSHEKPYISKRIIRVATSQTAVTDTAMQLLIESERSQQNITYDVVSGIQFVNNSGGIITFIGSGSVPINFTAGAVFQYVPKNTGGVSGIYLGFTLTGTVSGYSFNSAMLEYGDTAAFGSTAVAVGPA